MEKNNNSTALGLRFLTAFRECGNLTDKKKIAELIGYKSEKVIYKIVNGEQQMTFDALIRFRKTTGYSIDWLLTGEGVARTETNELSIADIVHLLAMRFAKAWWEIDEFVVTMVGEFPEFRRMLNDVAFKRSEAIFAQLTESVEILIKAMGDDDEKLLMHDLGTVDEFDIAAAVEKYDNALPVLQELLAHDKVTYHIPQTMEFHNWEGYSHDQKIQEVNGARQVIDSMRAFTTLGNAHEKKSSSRAKSIKKI